MINITDFYAKMFNITDKMAEKAAIYKSESGYKTAKKELIGDAVIRKYNLFDSLFPNNLGYRKISKKTKEDKEKQLAGIDYEVYTEEGVINVDLKSLVGQNYNMTLKDYYNPEDFKADTKGVVIEIYQNDIFTNSNDKRTDVMLYTICDEDGIYYSAIRYQDIQKISEQHTIIQKMNKDGTFDKKVNGKYFHHISFNGTGVYIKAAARTKQLYKVIEPVEEFDIDNVLTEVFLK